MSQLYGLDVAFDFETNDSVLDENVRTLVFHVARELLFNVVKHAGTEQASLHVGKAEDSDLVVRVSDEGAGFDVETMNDLTPVPRFGLASIRERIEVLGGRFDVESAPGQGTSVTIRLPASWDEEC
jgi:two-component system, chemotaxis family, CheB/CheR fusion protein